MKWAFLFPGQGSQFVGMGQSIVNAFPQAKHIFEEASDTLSYDMQKLCFEDPNNQLHLTEYTQPAILTVSIAIFQILKKDFLSKASRIVMAGHSVGEYAGHVASGTLGFAQGLALVQQRGHLMQEAVQEGKGGMVACIGLSSQEMSLLLEECRKEFSSYNMVLDVAAYNAPLQTVLSGHQEVITYLLQTNFSYLDFTKKPKILPIKVSAPFHCSLMWPAEEKMTPLIDRTPFAFPQYPIVPNVSAQKTLDVAVLKENLKKQITAPVKWTQTIEHLRDLGFKHFIEVGPGRVLSGLLKQIDKELKAFSISSPEDCDKLLNVASQEQHI